MPIVGKEFDGEVLLNVDFKLKTAEPLMAAGQTVAEMQMEVQPWQPMPKMEPVVKNKVKVTDNVKEGVVRFAGTEVTSNWRNCNPRIKDEPSYF